MASISVAGDTSGSITIAAPNVAGTNTLTLPASTGTVVVTSGAQTIEFADGSASTPSITNSGDTNTGMFFPAADTIAFAEGGTEAMRLDSVGNVGIGTTSPGARLDVANGDVYIRTSGRLFSDTIAPYNNTLVFNSGAAGGSERMRIDSSGALFIGKTAENYATQGAVLNAQNAFYNTFTRSGGAPISINRTTNDGGLLEFHQDGNLEGTISVSGTTVSYGGGHIARWSQWQNETGKPNVYRGTVLESVDAMCEWERNGEPLPNEQSTKTIVSTTVASKAVAGVFDRYDEDDKDNPYDFYVAQSGDFVIRIAQGVVVQNGDLLESAGDGTAKPQADDICRSSTVAKVTSNYVSATYEDGSYCVPCILMIG